MSGILKKIGKVFKKIVKSKIFKAVLIAAAIYFTAGIAAGAMGSAFAASLPGISTAAGAIGLGEVGAFGVLAADAMAVTTAAAGAGALATGVTDLAITGTLAPGISAAGALTEGAGFGIANAAAESFGSQAVKTVAGQAADVVGEKVGGPAGAAISGAGKLLNLSNPTVAKAALTFGSEALKTGVGLYAAKSQQEATEEREAQDREDRARRGAVPGLATSVTYKTPGIINTAIKAPNEEPQP